MNISQGLALTWQLIKDKNISDKAKRSLITEFDQVLALDLAIISNDKAKIPAEIIELAKQRQVARENNDWSLADELRDKISQQGYTIKDTSDYFVINKKN